MPLPAGAIFGVVARIEIGFFFNFFSGGPSPGAFAPTSPDRERFRSLAAGPLENLVRIGQVVIGKAA